jgi:diguanylate cyclase (GGDEF)-like protein/PAS domain S-box-containing protein
VPDTEGLAPAGSLLSRIRTLFSPGVGVDAEYVAEYRRELSLKTLRLGRIASILTIVFLPLFVLQDVFVLKMSILPWRLVAFVPMMLFAVASFTVLRRRPDRVVQYFAIVLSGFMSMMSGIVVSVFSDPGSPPYLTYLVLDSLAVMMLVVFLFSAGARRYLPAILFAPLAAAVLYLAFAVGLPPARLSALTNPAAVAVALVVMASFQERLSFNEFRMRKLAETRGREAVRAEENVRESRQILQSFLDSVNERAFVIDADGAVVFANQAFAAGIGEELARVVGRELSSLLPAGVDARYRELRETALSSKRPARIEIEEGGAVLENTIYPVFDAGGEIVYLGILAKDITERKLAERQLEYWAVHDALTGLYNRRFLIESVKAAVVYAKRGHPCSLIYADLDDFKAVNDAKGHEAGDAVLRAVADILSASIRSNDAAFRVGGDEFAVVLRDMGLDGALQIAARLGQAVRERRFTFDGDSFPVGLSIGVTEIDGTRGADEAVALADAAMYRAKRGGKNRIES